MVTLAIANATSLYHHLAIQTTQASSLNQHIPILRFPLLHPPCSHASHALAPSFGCSPSRRSLTIRRRSYIWSAHGDSFERSSSGRNGVPLRDEGVLARGSGSGAGARAGLHAAGRCETGQSPPLCVLRRRPWRMLDEVAAAPGGTRWAVGSLRCDRKTDGSSDPGLRALARDETGDSSTLSAGDTGDGTDDEPAWLLLRRVKRASAASCPSLRPREDACACPRL
jgi:hypothetical protein